MRLAEIKASENEVLENLATWGIGQAKTFIDVAYDLVRQGDKKRALSLLDAARDHLAETQDHLCRIADEMDGRYTGDEHLAAELADMDVIPGADLITV